MKDAKKFQWRNDLVGYLAKRIEKDHSARAWRWRDGCFEGTFGSIINHISLMAKFEVRQQELVTTIDSTCYGIPSERATFDCVEGIQECARWTAEKLSAIYDTVIERAAPYLARYEQALRGAL